MLRYIFLSVFALLLLTACGGTDLDKLIKTGECLECDLTGADLTNADLTEANLTEAALTGANLTGAILDDVIGTGFTGALNVPEKYLRD